MIANRPTIGLIQINVRRRATPILPREGAMDACYYSIIERGEDGHFWGWVPDLPGVSADGLTEKEVVDRLVGGVRECLRNLIVTGEPVPRPRPPEELPRRDGARELRRLLLIIS